MNTQVEIQKIKTILENRRFEYKGVVYKLDVKATANDNINANLHDKPLKKLTGTDKDGNVLHIWSHDCRVASTDIGKVEAPKVVVTSTEPKHRQMPEKKVEEIKAREPVQTTYPINKKTPVKGEKK